MPIDSLAAVTELRQMESVATDDGVATARRRVVEVADAQALVERQVEALETERVVLHLRTQRGVQPKDIADRAVAIERTLADMEIRRRALAEQQLVAQKSLKRSVAKARAAELRTLEQRARQVTVRMVPLVEQLAGLNAELTQIRRRAGYKGAWPLPFEMTGIQPTERWLATARAFSEEPSQ